MKGYKIAVGVSREIGFFPVMVELDIPETACVVKPLLGTFVNFDIIDKYRTDECTVVSIENFTNAECQDWNGKAFSLFELVDYWLNDYDTSAICTIYEKNYEIASYVDKDITVNCGQGIHFFASKVDAKGFYYNDLKSWVYGSIYGLNQDINNDESTGTKRKQFDALLDI